MKKLLLLPYWPARNGLFLPKFWTALATVIVGIFFEKIFSEVLNILEKSAFSNFSKAFISRFSELLDQGSKDIEKGNKMSDFAQKLTIRIGKYEKQNVVKRRTC